VEIELPYFEGGRNWQLAAIPVAAQPPYFSFRVGTGLTMSAQTSVDEQWPGIRDHRVDPGAPRRRRGGSSERCGTVLRQVLRCRGCVATRLLFGQHGILGSCGACRERPQEKDTRNRLRGEQWGAMFRI